MDWLCSCPHLRGVSDGLVKPKLITRCATVCCEYLCKGCTQEVNTTHNRTPSYQFWSYQAISNTLKMGMESVPEMMENFQHLYLAIWLRKFYWILSLQKLQDLCTTLHPKKQYSSKSPLLEPPFYIQIPKCMWHSISVLNEIPLTYRHLLLHT